jgi:tetratricopeptide (TPR) repeat protein
MSDAPNPSQGDGSAGLGAPEESLDADLRQAVAMHQAGRIDEAIARYRDILDREPEMAGAWTNLGVALRARGHRTAALACVRRAQELQHDIPGLLGNLGNLLKDLGRFEEGLEAHRAAVRELPNDARAHYNLGLSLRMAGDPAAALASFDEACRLDPSLAEAYVDRSLLRLEAGDFARAWPDYEHRYALPEMARHRFEGSRWAGEPFPGRTLLVHYEQGLGDSMFAARFLAAAKRRGGEVWLQCPAQLQRLFARLPGVDRLCGVDERPEGAELHCGMLSLPGLLATDPATIPAPARFEIAEPPTPIQAELLRRAGDRFRVGIFWSGNPRYKGNALRAAPLQPFLELARQPGIQLYSLQTGSPREMLAQVECDPIVIDTGDALGDFASTAAFVRELDVVVMTDSALAHLTGSLGRPIWVMLGIHPYWYWGTKGDRTPWYPSMRLFRAGDAGMWREAMDEVAGALGEAVALWRAGEWPKRGA